MTDRIEEIFDQVINEDCPDPLRRFAELVRQDEREACAYTCEINADGDWTSGALACAAAIRARSKHD